MKKNETLRIAYKLLVRIADNNDPSCVPFIAAITDAYYREDKEKIVEYLKDVKGLADKLINELQE